MDSSRYFIAGRTVDANDVSLQAALARVYATSERPRCMCVPGGVEMYVARHAAYVIKRMPDSGHLHRAACPSFEPDAGCSGLGELVGEAIVEHAPDEIEIHTDFPLARVSGRPPPRGEPSFDPSTVCAPRKGISLRALLHFLYERAGFNRWYPAMEGRRTQGVLHKYLTEAARGVLLKGEPLDGRLYVPEPFRLELKNETGERRRRKLALLLSPESAGQFKMAIVIGEFNGCVATPYGRRVSVKHMADAPLFIDNKTWKRVERAYGPVLQARDADVNREPRALMAALIYAKREHIYQIDTLSMMLTTDQWIPLDGLHELPLIERLQREQRAFLKPLKYDARSSAAFANALLLDCGGTARALHVVSPFVAGRDRWIKDKAVSSAGDLRWVWHTDEEMPAFPERERSASNQPTP